MTKDPLAVAFDNLLRRVEDAASSVASAHLDLELAVRNAHRAGFPLREIAEAAGVSHETVRRICQQ